MATDRSLLIHILLYVGYTFRFALVLFTNIYAISAYCIWMLMLWPLRIMKPTMYWKIEGVLFNGLLSMVTTWFCTAAYTVIESGDDLRGLHGTGAILLANHQSTGDVPTLMAALQGKRDVGGSLYWIMDELFRFSHFGAVSSIRRDFFIKQGKDTRSGQLEKLAKRLEADYVGLDRRWMVIFPEGGFLYKRQESNKRYAEKNNLPVWKYTTLPRIGALKVVLDTLATDSTSTDSKDTRFTNSQIDTECYRSCSVQWIIDVTIAYDDQIPLSLASIGSGSRWGCSVQVHYRAYPVTEVPVGGLQDWVYARYAEKEELLEELYTHGTPLADTDTQKRFLPRRKPYTFQYDALQVILFHVFYLLSFYIHVSYVWKPLTSLLFFFF